VSFLRFANGVQCETKGVRLTAKLDSVDYWREQMDRMKRIILSILLTPVFIIASACVTGVLIYVIYLMDMATKKVGEYLSFVPFRDILMIGLFLFLIFFMWKSAYDFIEWIEKRKKK